MKSFIKIHEDDNVAVALQTVPAGTAVDPDRCSVSALEEIPAGHKIALTDIPEGVNIIKYGFPIGHAKFDFELEQSKIFYKILIALL